MQIGVARSHAAARRAHEKPLLDEERLDDILERATILAEGLRSKAVLDWLGDHDWAPEVDAPKAETRGGLYGTR